MAKVLGAVELAMKTVCRSTTATTCVDNLITDIDQWLKDACGTLVVPNGLLPVDGGPIVLPPGVAQCVVKALGAINLVMETVCRSATATTCVSNLITDIDQLLYDACGRLDVSNGVLPLDGGPIVLPAGVAECVVKALGTVNLVMEIACRSATATTCVSNLITDIDLLLQNVCGALDVSNGEVPLDGGPILLPPGVAQCVVKALGTVDLILKTACQSTDAATCVENLISQVDGLLKTACGLIPVPNEGATTGLPPGVSTCVVKTLGLVTLVMETVCDSPEALPCVENLIAQVGDLLNSTCGMIPVSDYDLDVEMPAASRCAVKVLGAIETVAEVVCGTHPIESCIANTIDWVDSVIAEVCGLIPVSDAGSIIGLPSSVELCISKVVAVIDLIGEMDCQPQALGECLEKLRTSLEELCPLGDCEVPIPPLPTSPTGRTLLLNLNARQAFGSSISYPRIGKLVRRIIDLAGRANDDGMGYLPDVLLLQEVFRDHPTDLSRRPLSELVSRLYDLTGEEYAVVVDFQGGDLDSNANTFTQGDTAILINKSTMEYLGKSHVDHRIGTLEVCTDGPRDTDGDGLDDCGVRKVKRSATALLAEKASGLQMAVASVHFLRKVDVITGMEDVKTLEWSVEVARHLRQQYPSAALWSIGGDFNRNRCQGEVIPLEQYREEVICQQRPFWEGLRNEGYVDSIYAAHGQTDERLSDQYRFGGDGSQYKNRIDYIFGSGATAFGSASHDLTCGGNGSCNDPLNSQYYSDHRLNWALLGPLAVKPISSQ
ncbi:MAG: endonuclease/exonuclease/phosphatase family protein [Actinomycetota bacterium]